MIIYNIRPATTALAETVIIQAQTIHFTQLQRTADNLVVASTPIIAPDSDSVVLTGISSHAIDVTIFFKRK
jgi:hypothetical protein